MRSTYYGYTFYGYALWLYLLYYDKQVAALYAHLRHQTKAYGTIEGLDQVDLRTLCATKVNPSAKVINTPKTNPNPDPNPDTNPNPNPDPNPKPKPKPKPTPNPNPCQGDQHAQDAH